MENFEIVSYDRIQSKEIRWLWYPYIPFGKITIVQGDPGEGKTTFVLSLLSILSRGDYLPLSNQKAYGFSIYQNTEDDNSDTVKPRLEKLGADCSRICFLATNDAPLYMDDSALEKAIRKLDARVLVLDPIQAFVGDTIDMNRANAIRPKLNHLKQVAEKTGCAVILVGHLNKNVGGKAAYRGLGSIDFVAAARSVLVLGRPEDDPDTRVIVQQKNNLAPIGPAISFEITDAGIEWIGHYDITVNDLFNGASSSSEGNKSSAAKDLLLELLESGERAFSEIFEIASDNKIGKRTLVQAKADLSVLSVKKPDGWYWKLPTQRKRSVET